MTKSKRPYTRLSRVQMLAIAKAIEPVIEKDGEYVRYMDGWSDERIGREQGGISPRLVANYRNEVFGNLKRSSSLAAASPAIAEMLDRVAKLEATDAARVALLAELERKLHALSADVVSLSKRLDIRERFTLPGPSDSAAVTKHR